jgi:cytochrome P450
MTMTDFEQIDYFSDPSLLADPHPYFDYLRAKGPVVRLEKSGVYAVTGYDEGVAVFRDDERFSAAIAANGPLPPLPFTPEGDDITDQIETHRHLIPGANNVATMDAPAHTRLRSLMMGMITPKRMQDNEACMWRLADDQIGRFIDNGRVEVYSEYARAFAVNVIADLLGVPKEDYDKVTTHHATRPGQIGIGSAGRPANPYEKVMGYFTEAIEQRRASPQADVISQLAAVRYADGSLPPVEDVVMIVVQLFGAGSDTTIRVIMAALRYLAEDPQLQRRVRADRQLIPDLVEEILRLAATTRSDFRLVRKPVKVGGVDLSPGAIVMLLIAAMDRDPRKFENPHELRLDRRNTRNHVAFGRGIHACIGAPLARAEIKVSIERFLDHTSDIRIDEDRHGPADARRYDYIPTYLLQGLDNLHLVFDKA